MAGAVRSRRKATLGALLCSWLVCCDVPAVPRAASSLAVSEGKRSTVDAASAAVLTPVRLALITDLHGVLEPCGCSRESLGGADRLAHKLAQMRSGGGSLSVIASGDLLFDRLASSPRRSVPLQAALKAETWVALFERLQFAAVVPGPADLDHGSDVLRGVGRNRRTAVLGPLARGSRPTLELRESAVLEEVGSQRVQLLAGGARASQVGIRVRFQHGRSEPHEPDGERADVLVQTGLQRARCLVTVDRGTLTVSAGEEGRELLLLELWPGAGAGEPWELGSKPTGKPDRNVARVEVHPLDATVPAEPEIRRLLDQVFQRIDRMNSALGDAQVSTAAGAATGGPAYVGARTCAACHTEAYAWWLTTPHARAYQTLLARKRGLDLDCIGCHVTGFDAPGGARLGHLDELKAVGCESCHGPGGEHVDNPRPPHRKVRRAVPEVRCASCHDPAHSDDFDYALKSALLRAPGHGEKRGSRAARLD